MSEQICHFSASYQDGKRKFLVGLEKGEREVEVILPLNRSHTSSHCSFRSSRRAVKVNVCGLYKIQGSALIGLPKFPDRQLILRFALYQGDYKIPGTEVSLSMEAIYLHAKSILPISFNTIVKLKSGTEVSIRMVVENISRGANEFYLITPLTKDQNIVSLQLYQLPTKKDVLNTHY
jgi:hypothetical protein